MYMIGFIKWERSTFFYDVNNCSNSMQKLLSCSLFYTKNSADPLMKNKNKKHLFKLNRTNGLSSFFLLPFYTDSDWDPIAEDQDSHQSIIHRPNPSLTNALEVEIQWYLYCWKIMVRQNEGPTTIRYSKLKGWNQRSIGFWAARWTRGKQGTH